MNAIVEQPLYLANNAPRARVPSSIYVPPPLQVGRSRAGVWEWFLMVVLLLAVQLQVAEECGGLVCRGCMRTNMSFTMLDAVRFLFWYHLGRADATMRCVNAGAEKRH
mgnify:FL=1